MALLAQQLSGKGIPNNRMGSTDINAYTLMPVSDEPLNHLIATGCTPDRLTRALLDDKMNNHIERDALEVETQLASISFESIIPTNIEKIPAEKILEIRNEYSGELSRFRKAIQSFANKHTELCQIENEKLFYKALDHIYRNDIVPAYKNFKRILNKNKIDTALSSANLLFSLPVALISRLSPIPIASTGSGSELDLENAKATVTALQAYLDKRFATSDAKRMDRMSFLLAIEENLQPTGLISRVVNNSRRLWLGA